MEDTLNLICEKIKEYFSLDDDVSHSPEIYLLKSIPIGKLNTSGHIGVVLLYQLLSPIEDSYIGANVVKDMTINFSIEIRVKDDDRFVFLKNKIISYITTNRKRFIPNVNVIKLNKIEILSHTHSNLNREVLDFSAYLYNIDINS